MPEKRSNRVPLNEHYARLGEALRRVRELAGKRNREVPKAEGGFYSTSTISNAEGGHTSPGVDLVKAYARLGGSYTYLMALRDKAKRPDKPDPTKANEFERRLLDPRSNPLMLRNGYIVDLQDSATFIDNNFVVAKNVYTVAIRPVSPTTQYFVFRYGYEEDPRRGVASIQAGAGCQIELLDEQDDGITLAVLKFDRSKLDEFGRCTFSYAITINSEVPSNPFDAVSARSLMVHIIKRIQFEVPAVPHKIWWFRGPDPFQEKLQPSDEQLLEINPLHFYVHEFYDVEQESCGLAWQWDNLSR